MVSKRKQPLFLLFLMYYSSCFSRLRGVQAFSTQIAAFSKKVPKPRQSTKKSLQASLSTESSIAVVTEQMRTDSLKSFGTLCEYYDNLVFDFKPPLLGRTPSDVVDYLQKHAITTVLFDCDGVLYRSPAPAPQAAAALQTLVDNGMRIFFVTNNSAANPNQLQAKLTHILGLPPDDNFLTTDMMISTAWTAAQYLKQQLLDNRENDDSPIPRAYVIGSDGLKEEIENTGIHVIRDADDQSNPTMSREALADHDFDAMEPIDAVVVGHDTSFSFRKLSIANVLLQRNPQALWVATNKDAFDLVGADGRHIPGNGSLVAALECSSGRTAVNVGKPSQLLIDLLESVHGVHAQSGTMFVGDRLDTDIKFALDTDMHAALVMTGVTTASQLQELQGGTDEFPLPTLIVPHVGFFAS